MAGLSQERARRERCLALRQRASIRVRLGPGQGDTRVREFRDVTPLAWRRRFSLEQVPTDKHREILFVNAEAMRVLKAHGGHSRHSLTLARLASVTGPV
jgi:hypothetical protein